MRKILSIFFILSILSVSAYAQGISGGVKLGLNLANQTFKGSAFTTSPSFRPGIHAGGYLTLMFSEHLGLQPEVLFSGQGYKSGNSTVSFNYINVPILVRFNVNKLLSFHAGPQVGMLMSAKNDYGSGTQDIKDSYKGTDVSVAVGGTIDIPFGLNFTLRFIKGLSDINDTPSDVVVKNYNLQVSVGYKLFGKK
jgi:hypothetical protein